MSRVNLTKSGTSWVWAMDTLDPQYDQLVAQGWTATTAGATIPASLGYRPAVLQSQFGGLTFYKDYSIGASVDANYAAGSPTGTFTVTRSASTPATIVDRTGLIRLVTDTNPRMTDGFYDSTGFVSRPGIIMEGASTNLIPKSSTIDDATWTESNTTAENADAGSASPDGTATAPSLTATAGNGTLLLTTAVTARTYSVWLKRKTGTGTINITANGGTGWTAVTVTSSWTRHQVTAASASQACGIRIVTSGDAVYVWGNQFEALPFASSLIPTTTAALTRNAETLTYPISGNRTADTESIFTKFTPFWSGADVLAPHRLHDTDTKSRRTDIETITDSLGFLPNGTDSASAIANGTTDPVKFTSYTDASIAYGPSAATNCEIYLNGISEATDADNYTSPAWGTNFYVGCSSTAARELHGIIQSLAIFSDAKDAAGVASIAGLL